MKNQTIASRPTVKPQRIRVRAIAGLLGWCGLCLLCQPVLGQSRSVAFSANQSLQQIELAPGFAAVILASEPQVVDPIDVAVDDAGRLWVVEMRDYPFRVAEQARGRIRVLSDLDQQGRYQTVQVFADHLEMPTGLALWQDGLVVTLAGRLVFMRDTNGDGTADETQVWLEGFAEDNEQLRANHPRLGPEGKWTIASGLRGGNVQLGSWFAQQPGKVPPMAIGSRDIRFAPDTAQIELVTGPAQFGLCFDLYGNRYFCSNRNPAVQVMLEQEDLSGNPLAGILPSVRDVIPAGEQSQVFPLVDAWTTSNLHAGQFTAACGVFVRPLAGNPVENRLSVENEIFVCEPTGSLIKRSLVALDDPRGATSQDNAAGHSATAEATNQAELPEREWLASRDAWFRPVNIAHAPDGGLLVVDMHRAVIEHPHWVPDELKQRPDERWGEDCGRIYWVGQDEGRLPTMLLGLQESPLNTRSSAELAELVSHENAWFRETAARLLMQRKATEQSGLLTAHARSPSRDILGRMAALALAIQFVKQVPNQLLESMAAQAPPELQIVMLKSLRQSHKLEPQHAAQLIQLATAQYPAVRYEALLCLGQLPAPFAEGIGDVRRLGAAAATAEDPYMLVAAASALRSEPQSLLLAWLQALENQPTAMDRSQLTAIAQGLARAIIKQVDTAEQTKHAAYGDLHAQLAQSAFKEGTSSSELVALAALAELLSPAKSRETVPMADAWWSQVAQAASNSNYPSNLRTQCISLLGISPRTEDQQLLSQLARQEQQPQAKAELLRAWARRGGQACDDYLLECVSSSSPALLVTIFQLIGQHPQRLSRLAEELAMGRLTARQIGANQLKQLVTRATGTTKNLLEEQLGQLVNSDRGKILDDYRSCLTLTGDALRGKQVFRTQCATCHRIGDTGVQLGPDISDSRTQQPLQLLTAIIHPNLAIDNNYFRYVILTQDEEIIEGLIAEESAESIVMLGQDSKRNVVPRSEIAELKATGVSMMPEGLEAQINPQAMADLIAFIKGWRYMDGSIPGK